MVSKVCKGTLIPWGRTLWTVTENKSQQIEIQHHSTEFKKTISLPFRIHWAGQPGENHISLERATILHLRYFYWCNISVSPTCNYLNFMSLRYSNPLTSFHRWKSCCKVLAWEQDGSAVAQHLCFLQLLSGLQPLPCKKGLSVHGAATKSLLDNRGHAALQMFQTTEASLNPCSERRGNNKEWLGMLSVTAWRTQGRKRTVSGFYTDIFLTGLAPCISQDHISIWIKQCSSFPPVPSPFIMTASIGVLIILEITVLTFAEKNGAKLLILLVKTVKWQTIEELNDDVCPYIPDTKPVAFLVLHFLIFWWKFAGLCKRLE